MAHPDLQGLRRWTLFTRDAHALYRRFGFGDARHPDRLMEILADPYAPPRDVTAARGALSARAAPREILLAYGPGPRRGRRGPQP